MLSHKMVDLTNSTEEGSYSIRTINNSIRGSNSSTKLPRNNSSSRFNRNNSLTNHNSNSTRFNRSNSSARDPASQSLSSAVNPKAKEHLISTTDLKLKMEL